MIGVRSGSNFGVSSGSHFRCCQNALFTMCRSGSMASQPDTSYCDLFPVWPVLYSGGFCILLFSLSPDLIGTTSQREMLDEPEQGSPYTHLSVKPCHASKLVKMAKKSSRSSRCGADSLPLFRMSGMAADIGAERASTP